MVEPIFDDQFTLFPNPSTESINVAFRLPEQALVKMTIYNLQGKLMHAIEEQSPKGQQHQMIDINHYPSGAYLILLQYHGKSLSQQFIKM